MRNDIDLEVRIPIIFTDPCYELVQFSSRSDIGVVAQAVRIRAANTTQMSFKADFLIC